MKRGLTATIAAVLVGAFALGAFASTGQISLSFQVKRGAPGTEVLMYSGPMPVVGETCTVLAADAGNNRSVHPGNNLRLDTGGDSITFSDIERAPNVSTPGSGPIVPAATGEVYLVFGPDGVYSADLILEFTCETTTTTSTSTTTTAPESSSTTSTAPSTTSTQPESTTSTQPETTTTEPSTSTSIDGTTTTTAGTSVTVPHDELPFTGGSSPALLIGAGVLFALGLGLVRREHG